MLQRFLRSLRHRYPNDDARGASRVARLAGVLTHPAAPYVLVGVSVPIARLAIVVLTSHGSAGTLFEDDAFYYFRIARNIALGHGSTYDGQHSTNGYQPLWLGLLLPLFSVLHDRYAVLAAVAALQGALWAATVALVYRLGKALGDVRAATWGLVPALLIGADVTGGNFSFGGMEVTLTLTALVAVSALALRTGILDGRVGVTTYAVVGILLAAITLSRLDAAVFAAVFALVLAVYDRSERPARLLHLALVAGPTAVTTSVYLCLNQSLFGVALPVSALAKTGGVPTWNTWFLRRYFTLPWSVTRMPIPLGILLACLVVPTAVLAGRLAASRRAGQRPPWVTAPSIRRLTAVFGVAIALQLLVYVLTTDFGFVWYFFLSVAAVVVFTSVTATLLATALEQRAGRWVRCTAVLAVLVLLPVVIALDARPIRARRADDWRTGTFRVAEWLNRHTPRSSTVAMGDAAGVTGYFLDRPLIQLEGLVESRAYLDALLRDDVAPFLRRSGVRYVVTSNWGPSSVRRAASDTGCAPRPQAALREEHRAFVRLCTSDIVFTTTAQDRSWRFTVWRYKP